MEQGERLSVVLRRMLEVIPDEEKELREELDQLYESACFVEKRQEGAETPPPDMSGMWTLCAGSLETHLTGKQPSDWVRRVSAILRAANK